MTVETNANQPFVVMRRARLASPLAPELRDGLSEKLVKEPGILKLEVEADGIGVRLSYDRSWTDFEGVAWAFAQAGHPLRADMWAQFKFAWYARQDRKARTVGKLPDSACCGPSPAGDQERER